MRILFVLEYFWPQVGGVETMFDTLTRDLVRRGHTCDVLTTRLPSTPESEVHDGVRIFRVGNAERPNRYAFTFQSIRPALRLARQADVLHTSTYNAAAPAWWAGMRARVPAVITVHEILGNVWFALPDTPYPHAAFFKLMELAAIRLPFDRYVAVSRATRNALRQAGAQDRKLRTVYNGMATQGWEPDPETVAHVRREHAPGDERLVLYYGRPGVTKGVEVLIDAFRIVTASEPNTRLVLLLGAYPAERRTRLARRAEEVLGVNVTILPSAPWKLLPSYLAAADCVVVPSFTEGFGFTTVESASLGALVVAHDVGSIPEVVSGRHVLVEPNGAESLAKGILTALHGRYTTSPIRQFSNEAMTDGYLNVYNEAVRARSHAGSPS